MASEMRTIKLNDQDWKVTPFHCVVGPIDRASWDWLMLSWLAQLKPASVGRTVERGPFVYPIKWKALVEKWRSDDPSFWRVHYENNPLIVNEYKMEEITLVCIDDGKLIVTNFADLPGADVAAKIYLPGEFWLNYCEGGAERALREGRARKG
jgi:hypothetical protein